jgi:CRP-like cAMP-binding protein
LNDSKTDIDALGRVALKSNVFMGDFVCEQGDEGDRMWLLVEGSVEVIVSANWGGTGQVSEKVVASIDAPGYFGEMALIDKVKGGVRGASIRATTECELFVIMEHDFTATLGNTTAGLIETLRSVPFLCNKNTDVDALTRAAKQASIKTGKFVCRQGDLGDRMWLLTEGSVEVIATADWDNTGKKSDKVVATIQGPGYFGEMALIDKAKGGVRGAAIRAVTDVTLYAIMMEDFQNAAGKSTAALVRTLRSVPFLSDMPNEVDHMARIAVNNRINKGAVVCNAGDEAQCAVKIRVRGDWTNSGLLTEKVVAEVEAPGYFGEMALLTRNGTRSATIIAVVDCDLYEVMREDFEATVMQNKAARDSASMIGASRRHQVRVMEAICKPVSGYMIGTASIDYIYEKEKQALWRGRGDHICTCCSGSPTERTFSCPLHRPAAGKRAIYDRVAPVPHQPDEMSTDKLVTRTKHCVNKGMYHEALECLDRLLLLQPDNIDALRQRGICLAATRDYGGAVKDAQEYTRRVPDDAHGWLRVADAFYGLRKYDYARKAYVRAGKVSPSADFTRKVSILFDNAKYRHNSFLISCPALATAQEDRTAAPSPTRPSKAMRFSSPMQHYICNLCLMKHPCKCKRRRKQAPPLAWMGNSGVRICPDLSGKDG